MIHSRGLIMTTYVHPALREAVNKVILITGHSGQQAPPPTNTGSRFNIKHSRQHPNRPQIEKPNHVNLRKTYQIHRQKREGGKKKTKNSAVVSSRWWGGVAAAPPPAEEPAAAGATSQGSPLESPLESFIAPRCPSLVCVSGVKA